MATERPSRISAQRYIDETVALIAERGGSADVNLREVSRRLGCAHTNVYNYFASFDDLLWSAFRAVLEDYGAYLRHDLEDALASDVYLRRLITNLVVYPQRNPGLYRFIGSDPLRSDIPGDILGKVVEMKQRLYADFRACVPGTDPAVADEACDIVYAYIDGETFNLINERVVPGEDVGGRVVANAVRLFTLLTREQET